MKRHKDKTRDLERWQQIEAAFDQAQETAQSQHADTENPPFMQQPVGEQFGDLFDLAVQRRRGPGIGPGDQIGPYQIESLVGQGGMGTVFRAFRADGSFDQIVALKVLHRGPADEQSHQRFVQERQILAGLKHSNIARLLDGGVHAGSPFLVMEFVEGQPITEFCKTQNLPTEQRIDLFLQVANAIHYAHRRGIVHRDIKPSNLLVEAGKEQPPRAVVLDFGIALIEDQQQPVTSTGQVIGTPGYMSPEQAIGQRDQIDRRSDVFSLGVILYELLTDHRPFQGNDVGEVLMQLLDGEPTPMSKYIPNVPTDLMTIVTTSLDADIGKRYASVRALADDLERYLDGAPISARPIGFVARWVRRARQRPRTTALIGVSTLVMLASLTALVVMGIRHTQDLATERNAAVLAKQEAEGLLDFMLSDLHQGLQQIGRLDVLLDVAQQTLDYYQRYPITDNESDIRRRSQALVNAGEVFEEQGQLDQALQAYSRDLTALQQVMKANPASDLQLELARSHNALAGAYVTLGELDDALQQSQVGLEQSRRLIDRGDNSDRAAQMHFSSLTLRGWVLREAGQIDEAMQVLRAAETFARDRATLAPDWQHQHAVVLSYIGLVHYQEGHIDDALQKFIPARQLCEGLVERDSANNVWREELQLTLGRIGSAWLDLGDNEAAIAALTGAREQSKILLLAEPNNANWLRELAVVEATLAAAYLAIDDLVQAEQSIYASLNITQTLSRRFPDNHSIGNDLAWDLLDLGRVQAKQGRTTESRQSWIDALQTIQRVRKHEPDARYFMDTEVQILLELGHIEQAQPLIDALLSSGWKAPDFIDLLTEHGLVVGTE